MPKPIVYIETTIPNFYYDFRSDPAIVERHLWTRDWWTSAKELYDLVTSETVVEELSAGTSQFVPLRLELIRDLPLIAMTPEVRAAAETYIHHKLMPGRPSGDAHHLALASSFGCDFIVTWNYRHLANPNKVVHMRRINARLGLRALEIVTPLNLLESSR